MGMFRTLALVLLDNVVTFLESDIHVVTHAPGTTGFKPSSSHETTESALAILEAQLLTMLENGQTIHMFAFRTTHTAIGTLAFYSEKEGQAETPPVVFSGPPEKIRVIAVRLGELLDTERFAAIKQIVQVD